MSLWVYQFNPNGAGLLPILLRNLQNVCEIFVEYPELGLKLVPLLGDMLNAQMVPQVRYLLHRFRFIRAGSVIM
jgi:hypothetical protein